MENARPLCITAALQRQGLRANGKRVLRVTNASVLLCRPLKGFVVTTNRCHRLLIYATLDQNREPSAPDQIWVSDITYIRLGREFIYLTVILDAFSRRAIDWALSKKLNMALTLDALRSAVEQRRPSPGCIHHNDQGVQYANDAYTDLLKAHGFAIRMSRKGNPYDNAMMESFFATLKKEEVNLWDYETLEEARARLPHFIEQVYNQKRRHSSLGYRPPAQFETQQNQSPIYVLTNPA